MRLIVQRYSLQIVPEGPADEALLEETLGLKSKSDEARAVRVNAMGLSCWAFLEIKRKESP